MNILYTIEQKIIELKNSPDTLYTGIEFETKYQEKLKELELLNKEIDNSQSKDSVL